MKVECDSVLCSKWLKDQEIIKDLLEAAKIAVQMADALEESSDYTMPEDFIKERNLIKKAIKRAEERKQ